MKEIPKVIFLQTGNAEANGEAEGPEMDDEITWCENLIYTHDTMYVRADLLPPEIKKQFC